MASWSGRFRATIDHTDPASPEMLTTPPARRLQPDATVDAACAVERTALLQRRSGAAHYDTLSRSPHVRSTCFGMT
jgi:hypothetical protein